MQIDRRFVSYFDFALLTVVLLIPILGLVVLFSAGYDPNAGKTLTWPPISIQSQAFLKQLSFFGIGLAAMLCAIMLPPALIGRIAYWAYALCIVLLIGVELFGSVVKGSQRWLSLGGFHLQPAEPMKLALIFALAKYLSKNPPLPGGYSLRGVIVPFALVFFPVGLILRQPDLGTALAVLAVGLGMVLFVGIRPKVLLILILPVVIGIYPAWNSLHDYQKRRIQVLLDPEIDPRGSGYQIKQSKIAVGSGRFFGKGYMLGTQSQLEFLPEHTTDFIFSVLAEEWGFVGAMLVLSLYAALLYRLTNLIMRSRDLFAAMVVVGVGTLFFIHMAINVGMVIGLLPVVGIPLPLFSYGGSSLVSCLFAMGLVLGFDMRRLLFMGR